MGKSRKIINGVTFTVVGSRKLKRHAQNLADKVRDNHLARVIKGRDARGKRTYHVWASIKKKRIRK